MISVSSGFLLGLVGSLHCVGMCGPLVLALPLSFKDRLLASKHMLLYNFGRVATYTLLGAAFGVVGWGVEFSGFQKVLSISLGLLLVISPLSKLLFSRSLLADANALSIAKPIISKMKTYINRRSQSNTFQFGMLNGLLPCGLVYTALASSTLLGTAASSALYLFLFGLGTVPLMLMTMIGGHSVKGLSIHLRKILPYLSALFGLYLIYRGLIVSVSDEPMDIVMGLSGVMCH